MAVMSRLRRRNVSTTLPRGWARHSVLATEGKKSGTTLGGRGYGKLKQATIIKLTGYHGKAIRSYPGDLDAIRNAVFATFFNAVSTNEDPVYVRLGHPDWLRCCLKGATQNALESHGEVSVGFQRVMAATCATIAEFNQGVESTVARTYDTMGINLRQSAAKADDHRLQQSRHKVLDSTRAARHARVVARAHAQEADYAAGAF